MQFVENHINIRHLFKHPHRWIMAFLLSPIHLAEMHYKRKYHLKFAHAKKLFVFDMLLLLSTILLFAGTIFWTTYDPTVTDLVYVSIKPGHERLLSGQEAIYIATIKNESEVRLTSAKLMLELPEGFILDTEHSTWQKGIVFDATNYTYVLSGSIEQNEEATFTITGIYYGTPHIETELKATLVYMQEGKVKSESKSGPHISILQGSVLKSILTLPTKIISKTSVPFSLKLTNDGEVEIEKVITPFELPSGASLTNLKTNKGTIMNSRWTIETLEAKASAALSGYINISIPDYLNSFSIHFTPEITLLETDIPQTTIIHDFEILHPHIQLSASWVEQSTTVSPNETRTLKIDLKNDSAITLTNAKIIVPIPSTIIATNKLFQLNNASFENNSLVLDNRHMSALGTLAPGGSVHIDLKIPIVYNPQGETDLTLILHPEFSAQLPQSTDTYKTSTQSSPLAIGTQVFLNAELRYYTKEGDQLGRGPLPPEVGNETKYWAIIQINNTTSRIENLKFSATLPSYAIWTGKTSVSHGNDVTFNPATKQVSWSLQNLPAYSNAGLYFELSLIPSTDMAGTNPIMLQNISISATDGYIDVPISRSATNIDNSLKHDPIGSVKGTLIQTLE